MAIWLWERINNSIYFMLMDFIVSDKEFEFEAFWKKVPIILNLHMEYSCKDVGIFRDCVTYVLGILLV